MEIGFKSFREIYTSEVIYNNQNSKIEVTSINGNIKKLLNIWEFEEVDKKSCNVIFFIDIVVQEGCSLWGCVLFSIYYPY